ncbi:hypothetical protein [uncultured Paraglaciecola sp.]|uniref:hypothetical protein n=1 Tax=uncultured Paraglaciecola sp. TaxID=1765024 RepID=UPI00262AE999|nr:hypothetical protein [uncultured Paraglaciecola sp.]
MAEHNQRFETHTEWCNKASSWLTRHERFDEKSFRAICFDTKGRHCPTGREFQRAKDEGCFPIRWLWPDQIGPLYFGQIKPDAPDTRPRCPKTGELFDAKDAD